MCLFTKHTAITLVKRDQSAESPETYADKEYEGGGGEPEFPVSPSRSQPRVDAVDGLLKLTDAAHVVDDHRRSTTFLSQWQLSADSLLRGRLVTAAAIAQSLALHLLRTAHHYCGHFPQTFISSSVLSGWDETLHLRSDEEHLACAKKLPRCLPCFDTVGWASGTASSL